MKWLKISIIPTRSLRGMTDGPPASPPPGAGEGEGGGTQYDRPYQVAPPPHPSPAKREREQTELVVLIQLQRPLARVFAGTRGNLSREYLITVYPCMVRPPETLMVWPVM